MRARHAEAPVLVLVLLAAACSGRKAQEAPPPAPPPAPAAASAPAPAAASAPAAPVQPSWSLAAADPARTASTSDPGPEKLPGVLWSCLVAPDVVSEPIRAATPAGERILVGSGEDVLALDFDTGRTAWSYAVHSLVNAAPLPIGTSCFVAGSDGVGFLLSLADGKEQKKLEYDFVLESSPLRLDGLALFEETSYSSKEPSSILHALDTATQESRWTYEYPNGASGMAATDGTRVFIATTDGIRACGAADGKEAWFYQIPKQNTQYGPCLRDGRLYYVHGGMSPWDADCVDAATGKRLWTTKLPGRGCAPVALTDADVLVPMLDGTLLRVALADGKLAPPMTMPARVEARPAVGRSRVFLGAGKTVVALDRSTWQEAWRMEFDGPVQWVTIAGDRLLVARMDGHLHCLGS